MEEMILSGHFAPTMSLRGFQVLSVVLFQTLNLNLNLAVNPDPRSQEDLSAMPSM
jgi:hypothetical protein